MGDPSRPRDGWDGLGYVPSLYPPSARKKISQLGFCGDFFLLAEPFTIVVGWDMSQPVPPVPTLFFQNLKLGKFDRDCSFFRFSERWALVTRASSSFTLNESSSG